MGNIDAKEIENQVKEDFKVSSRLKDLALAALKGNWLIMVLASLVVFASYGLTYLPWIGSILILAVFPLWIGYKFMGLDIIRSVEPRIETMVEVFNRYVPYLTAILLTAIFIFLWMLLLIIPGIIKAYAYSMTFYIMRDNPDMPALDAIHTSEKMMYGHKWEFFLLQLSFIGWYLLAILTAGIGFLWLAPYYGTTQAAFYERIQNLYNQQPQPVVIDSIS